ncbi:MAG: MFS transporter [Candidatus Dormiibacterota bacterium]
MTLIPSADAPPAPTRAHGVVSSEAFRLLIGSGTSSYGDWLTTVALLVLLYRLTGSAVGPTVYMLARVAPKVVGPFPGGALADRFGPARVAATCACAQAVLTASIVVFADNRAIWPIYVAVALAQFFGSAAQPCYSALIPRVTTPEHLGRVQGLYSALSGSSILMSPAFGALVLPFTTPQVLIGVDAVTFVIAAVMAATLTGISEGGSEPLSVRGMSAGVPVVRADPMLRFLTAAYVANAAAVTALQAVLVVAAAQRFGHDTAVGWLYAAVGAGSLLGTLPVIRKTPRRVNTLPIVAATALELIPLALFVFVGVLPVAVVLLFASGIGAALYQTRGVVGLQQRVPQELLGRTMAVIRSAQYVGMLSGALAAVFIVQPLGWEATVLIVCALGAMLLFFTAVTEGRGAPR